MESLRLFFGKKETKRALWSLLNSLMALLVSYVTYVASENVAWAVAVAPVAQAASQFFTKWLNTK